MMLESPAGSIISEGDSEVPSIILNGTPNPGLMDDQSSYFAGTAFQNLSLGQELSQ
jgi:hypothetical protein